ncbi:MAG TPA: nicotinamide riboside transporter PnuC [Terriglobales bacterium]|nr:nicotinamide riboside transporter PnuC [Terriglobales bacterium]
MAELLALVQRNWVELLGFLSGALCVWLLVKENIWNWPIGIANNIFYIFIFFRSGLYADMGLQFVYISIAVYGWWNWLHGGSGHSELSVSRVSLAGWFAYSGLAAVATAALYFLLRHTPSNVPLADGFTTALFLTAQYMMSRKLVENWWFWIVGDGFAIGLYIYKDLYLTAVLYTIFTAMCVLGLIEWQRTARKQESAVAASAY